MKFHIWSRGFSSEYRGSDYCVSEFYDLEEKEENEEHIEFIRENLLKSFRVIFDDPYVTVMTENEYNKNVERFEDNS